MGHGGSYVLGILASVAVAASAAAGPLNDWNLIVLGNHTTGSNIWGRVAVKGSMSGNAIDIGTRLQPRANFSNIDSVIVGGNISSTINLQAGDLRYGGNLLPNARINRNGVGQDIVRDTGVVSTIAGLESQVRSLANTAAGMAANSTSGVGSNSNRYTFRTGTATAGGIAVFTVGASLFSSGAWAEFTLDNSAGASTIIINVDASATSGDVRFTAGNIDANSFRNLADRVLWNFYNADDILVQRELFGSILAPSARLRNMTNLNGSVAVGSLEQFGEIHGPNFSQNIVAIPLPSAGGLAAAGLVAGFARRRRRAQVA